VVELRLHPLNRAGRGCLPSWVGIVAVVVDGDDGEGGGEELREKTRLRTATLVPYSTGGLQASPQNPLDLHSHVQHHRTLTALPAKKNKIPGSSVREADSTAAMPGELDEDANRARRCHLTACVLRSTIPDGSARGQETVDICSHRGGVCWLQQ
jgi:hypothetical protein